LVIERVGARDHAAGAVAEQIDGQARVALLCNLNQPAQVSHVLRDILDIEASTIGFASTAQIGREDGKAARNQLFSRPGVLAAMKVHTVADGNHRPPLALRQPRTHVDPHAVLAIEIFLAHQMNSPAVSAASRRRRSTSTALAAACGTQSGCTSQLKLVW
jgi:hypothetical protein